MSKFNKLGKKASTTVRLMQSLNAGLKEQGKLISQKGFGAALVSTESADEGISRLLPNAYENARMLINSGFSQISNEDAASESIVTGEMVEAEELPAHAEEAGAIMAMAAEDPKAYMENRQVQGAEGAVATYDANASVLSGELGTMDDGDVAVESFDEVELKKYMPLSIALNVEASQQDKATELFYRPVIVTPENIGYKFEIRLEKVWSGFKRDAKGKTQENNKRLLLDAIRDASILRGETLKVVPFYQETGAFMNKDLFMAKELLAPVAVDVNGVSVLTQPLKLNTEVDIIGLSQHPDLVESGRMDETDQLDGYVAIDTIYLQPKDATNEVLAVSLKELTRSKFRKTAEGSGRELGLQFTSNEIVIAHDAKAATGTAVAETTLKAIQDGGYDIRLQIKLDGTANTEFGSIEVRGGKVDIVGAYKDGVAVALDDDTLKPLLEATKLTVVGYTADTNRTNTNARTFGLMVDSDVQYEMYVVRLRSPFSIQKPIAMDKDNPQIDTLVKAVKAKMTNDAFTTLQSRIDSLVSLVGANGGVYPSDRIPQIEGVGKYYVKPYAKSIEIDMMQVLNSVSSSNKLEDIGGIFRSVLLNEISLANRDSAYFVALQQFHGNEKAHVAIMTDTYIAQFLNRTGDTRLLGEHFDASVEFSADKRINNRLIMALSRKTNNGEPDPLAWGNTLYCPEPITNIPHRAKGGAVVGQHQIAPRYVHINNCPVVVEVIVKNLDKAIKEATKFVTKAG